jgi:hypothetical protein
MVVWYQSICRVNITESYNIASREGLRLLLLFRCFYFMLNRGTRMIAPETLTASYSTLPFSSCTLLTAGKLHSAVKLNPRKDDSAGYVFGWSWHYEDNDWTVYNTRPATRISVSHTKASTLSEELSNRAIISTEPCSNVNPNPNPNDKSKSQSPFLYCEGWLSHISLLSTPFDGSQFLRTRGPRSGVYAMMGSYMYTIFLAHNYLQNQSCLVQVLIKI